jgi:inorganic triphosphatase YgiF
MNEQFLASSIEVESKFRIVASNASKIIEELASVENLGPYKLGQIKTVQIHDTYFDTANLDLSKIGAVLRARLLDHEHLVVTLKMKRALNTQESESIHNRIEIEGHPTILTLENIWSNLTNIGLVQKPFSQFDFYRIGFEGLFQTWGFQETFSGENQRISRPIQTSEDFKVAILSLDTVSFYNTRKRSKLFEIEIEAERDAQYTLPELSSLLQQQFSKLVEPSRKSKYEQGLEFIGLEDDPKIELKLNIVSDLDEFIEWLQSRRYIADFSLGVANQYKITDSYFDTPDFKLREYNCYLRVRRQGIESLLTFRRYKLSDDNQIIEQVEIRGGATKDTLSKIAGYINETQIVSINASTVLTLPNELHNGLVALGLHEVLMATIERLIFPVNEQGRYFANLKLDNVTFTASNKTSQYREIELSTKSVNDLIRVNALAYTLMSSQFHLKPIGQPKYITGLDLTLRGSFLHDDVERSIRVFSRTDMAEGIAPWARSIISRIDDKETFQDSLKDATEKANGNVEDSLQNLKKSIELAIKRSRNFRNTQFAMAVILFVLGLSVIAGSIFVALQGGSVTISIAGLTAGALIELLIYFPFQQITRTSNKIILLTTLGDGMRLSLEQIEDDQEQKKKYLKQMWSILQGSEDN